MNKRKLRSSMTTINDLYTDCLASILGFGEPPETWDQRLTCSYWHEAVPIALSRVTTINFGYCDDGDLVERVVDLCPNLTIVDGVVVKGRPKCCVLGLRDDQNAV